jgi:hypothetical protein
MAALCAGINAGGDSRTVEFISTKNAATVNARMKLRQFALRPIRVACHLSPRFGRVPATAASGIAFDAESRDLKRNTTDFFAGMGAIPEFSECSSMGLA